MIVLLIEDNPLDVAFIEAELEAEIKTGALQLRHARTLAEGSDQLARGDVDILLTDLELPDSQGVSTFRRILAEAPDIPVIVLTGNSEESVELASVEEGAQEFLCKDELTRGSLMRTLRFAIHRFAAFQRRDARKAKSIATTIGFIGSKGGVGTSTVALNVALTLVDEGKSVVLVELRSFFGTLASWLDVLPVVNLGTLSEGEGSPPTAKQIADRLRRTPLAVDLSGLRVLFAPQAAEHYRELEPEFVASLLQCLADSADYVILDLPACPSPGIRAALECCQRIVSVMEREATCVRAIEAFLGLLSYWRGGLSVSDIVVVNRAVSGAQIDVHEVAQDLNLPLLGVIPPAVDACHEANRARLPLVRSFPQHAASDSLRQLTRQLTAQKVIR